jgi:predicted MFS family arabinose efflux permease
VIERPLSGFTSAGARTSFWLFAVATFACFTTNSMLALLSVVLKKQGLSPDLIGIVLAAPAPSILITMLLAGPLITRFGALQVARTGALIMLMSYLSFDLTVDTFFGAISSRVGHGVGYALFMPAAMIYADSNLSGQHKLYYFGIYASMFPLPNVLGPPLAEAYLQRFGVDRFFLYTALPALLGITLIFAVTPTLKAAVGRAALINYVHLLRRRSLWIPYGGIFVVGMFYGFVVSFMALLLESRRIPVSYFFVTFTICLFGSRFLLVRYIQTLPRAAIFATGLGLLCSAYFLLALNATASATVAAGIFFGLGYSVAYPTLSVWVTQQFGPDKQGMPLTLYNAIFTLGIFILPLIGGYVIAWLGIQQMVLGMAFGGLVAIVLIWLANQTRQHSE